jgi:hypothetical protein
MELKVLTDNAGSKAKQRYSLSGKLLTSKVKVKFQLNKNSEQNRSPQSNHNHSYCSEQNYILVV